jgi:hypothetical protein
MECVKSTVSFIENGLCYDCTRFPGYNEKKSVRTGAGYDGHCVEICGDGVDKNQYECDDGN